jgi:hypothetical protein
MGFENTNFIDDLGHKVGQEHPILGCLTVLIVAFFAFGILGAIGGLYTYMALAQKAGNPAFKDGKKTITFKPPEKWACFNAAAAKEPYVMNKVFVEKTLMMAQLETLPYKGISYSKSLMQYDACDISGRVRSALKARELKDAHADEKKKIKDKYEGYKRVKCVYTGGYGYSIYKKDGIAKCYYFKGVKNFIIVMAYIYEDSDKNRDIALKEEAKIKDMWEKAFTVKPDANADGVKTLSGPVGRKGK